MKNDIRLIRLSGIFVMLLITGVLWLNPCNLPGRSYPAPKGWVSDFANVLSRQTQHSLLNIITELKEKTDFEIAVAIVPALEGESVEVYANELYRHWGIGSQNDEGILMLIAVEDRAFRFETGYGAEGFLPDGKLGEVADRFIIPELGRNDYNRAVINGVVIIAELVAQEKNVSLSGTADFVSRDQEVNPLIGIVGFLFFIFLMIVTRGRILPWLLIFSMGSRGRGFGGGMSRGGGFGGFGGFGSFGGGSSGGGGVSRGF